MRSLLVGAALLATVASSATAQVTMSAANGAPDPGPFAGQLNIVNFNGQVVPAGITITGGQYATGSLSGVYAEPPTSYSGPHYYTTSAPHPSTVVIDFSTWLSNQSASVTSLSFYWGSIDTYNTLEVLGPGNAVLGTVLGAQVGPADGNQTLPANNRRVNLAFGATEAVNFRALRFTSGQAAFEFDDIAMQTVQASTTTTTTPEPATVTLVAVALSALGLAGARRKRSAASVV